MLLAGVERFELPMSESKSDALTDLATPLHYNKSNWRTVLDLNQRGEKLPAD